jgi:hypothetical protein
MVLLSQFSLTNEKSPTNPVIKPGRYSNTHQALGLEGFSFLRTPSDVVSLPVFLFVISIPDCWMKGTRSGWAARSVLSFWCRRTANPAVMVENPSIADMNIFQIAINMNCHLFLQRIIVKVAMPIEKISVTMPNITSHFAQSRSFHGFNGRFPAQINPTV